MSTGTAPSPLPLASGVWTALGINKMALGQNIGIELEFQFVAPES